jgi:hypothetical protein
VDKAEFDWMAKPVADSQHLIGSRSRNKCGAARRKIGILQNFALSIKRLWVQRASAAEPKCNPRFPSLNVTVANLKVADKVTVCELNNH